MNAILQSHVPYDVKARTLPGVAPLEMCDWLLCDDAFVAQMALRSELLTTRREDVLAMTEGGRDAADELLRFVLDWLSRYGKDYSIGRKTVLRPDGHRVAIRTDDPMGTLGQLVQEDLCLLDKQGDAHVLTGAVLCFPASWRLREKIGRPLIAIHDPVPEYDLPLARRVQRLFDGVQPGRPMWRFNALNYAEPDLFQPCRRDGEYAGPQSAAHAYFRSERQCILRLPETKACVFSIHTFVVKPDAVTRG